MMQSLLINVFLALVYVLLTGNTSTGNIIMGFIIGFIVLWIYGRSQAGRHETYARKTWNLIKYACYFTKILVQSNIKIAWEVITPGMHQKPRIIRYPVHDLNDVEITILANSITLTPGTLVVDVSNDKKWIYVHCMYAQDRESAVSELDDLANHLRREVFAA